MRRGAVERYGPPETERVSGAWAQIAHEMNVPKEALSLLSIPGIGLMTAASQIAFLGDGSRFDSPDSYVNYVGLSERRFDSGTKVSKGQPEEWPARRDNCCLRDAHGGAWI